MTLFKKMLSFIEDICWYTPQQVESSSSFVATFCAWGTNRSEIIEWITSSNTIGSHENTKPVTTPAPNRTTENTVAEQLYHSAHIGLILIYREMQILL